MFKLIAVTNRHLCHGDFLGQVEALVQGGISAILLREKDLPAAQYKSLALQVQRICQHGGVPFIPHTFIDVAEELECESLHLPLPVLEANPSASEKIPCLGVSVHSPEQAQKALALGAAYLIAGHIFSTGCKKDLAPRGLGFLGEICAASPVPVYAIGGISPENIALVQNSGAKGACIMSALMKSGDPRDSLDKLRGPLA